MKKFIIFCLLTIPFISMSAQESKEPAYYLVVETMPIFKEECLNENKVEENNCNMKAIMNFVSENVVYPNLAIEKNIQGKVFVSFIIDEDGSAKDPTLLRGVDPLLDAEALRVIKEMPKFYKAGFQKGKPVKVKYIIPIVFKLAK